MNVEESMEHYKSNLREIRERIGISQDQHLLQALVVELLSQWNLMKVIPFSF